MKKYFLLLLIVPLLGSSGTIKYYDYCEALKNKKAFIFSWEEFNNYNKLNSTHLDSDSTKNILISKYNYDVYQFKDLTNKEFIDTLISSLENTSQEIPIIIYLIGRAEYDDLFMMGNLVTKDSDPSDQFKKSLTSFSLLRRIIQKSPNKNILFITDIDFDLHINPFHHHNQKADLNKYTRKTNNLIDTCYHEIDHKEVVWISSGNFKYGFDSDSVNQLSPFGKSLTSSLNSNMTTAEELYLSMKEINDKVHFELLGGKSKYYYRLK